MLKRTNIELTVKRNKKQEGNKRMKGNVIVGQSGGPTAAINASLAGVYRTAKDRGANKVYGMLHGIQGLLKEKYIDLSDHIILGNNCYVSLAERGIFNETKTKQE